MASFKWKGNQIVLNKGFKTSNFKKITGTRLGAILNRNEWNTPFKTWCDITKTWVEPFFENKYTIAGKTIEPKQIEMMKRYGKVMTPTQKFGKNYFNDTRGNFFNDEIFGGMWDALTLDDNGNVTGVIECKTTNEKYAENWIDTQPEYYLLQVQLYSYLLSKELGRPIKCYLVVSFLTEADYLEPEIYQAKLGVNTQIMSSDLPKDFEETVIAEAIAWYKKHIVKGVSPEFDDKKDKMILDELRKIVVDSDDINSLLAEAEILEKHIAEIKSSYADDEKRLLAIKDRIKETLINALGQDNDKAEVSTATYGLILSKQTRETIDKKKLIKDGLYDDYVIKNTSYVLRNKTIKGE